MVYGYCRISTRQQNIKRQVRNIQADFPEAVIVKESFTGTKMNRPEWNKIFKTAKAGDTIVFDSVSRMSRNAVEGVRVYSQLVDRGVDLVFLKEHYIDTALYKDALKDRIALTGSDEDEIFRGINNYFRKLANRQIVVAFDQAQKEVDDLHERTKEGIETARLNGKQIGQIKGAKYQVKKAAEMKKMIKKYSMDFGGSLNDIETMKITGISRNTYYKYKKQISEE